MRRTFALLLIGAIAVWSVFPSFAGSRRGGNQGPTTYQQATPLTADEARAIAQLDSGEDQATVAHLTTTQLEKDGATIYKVIFLSPATAHSYEIDAANGAVLYHYAYPAEDHNTADAGWPIGWFTPAGT